MDRQPDQNPRRISARPIQKDTSSAKVFAAILFVVLLIVIFGNRILSAGLEGTASPPDRPGNRGGNNDKPAGTGGEEPAPTEVKIDYPARCLKQVRPPEGSGLLVAERPEGISVVTPLGQSIASIRRSRGPVGFSPSGRFFAAGGGTVWSSTGRRQTPPATGHGARWAWSPVADCLLAVGRDGVTVDDLRGGAKVVVKGDVDTFAFSPSGDRLLVVMASTDPKRGGIWLADLAEREMRVLMPLKEAAERWVFYGWSRREKPILLAAGGKSGPKTDRLRVSFLPPGASSTCGDEIVVADKGRVATFGVTGTPKFLAADDRYKYLSVTCSPNGQYLAVVRALKGAGPNAARLVLLERDGSFVTLLTRGLYRDQTPSWGPPGTGVVLVRRPLGAVAAPQQVWFLPEGGVVQQVGLSVVESDGVPVLDWSADGVPGHPL